MKLREFPSAVRRMCKNPTDAIDIANELVSSDFKDVSGSILVECAGVVRDAYCRYVGDFNVIDICGTGGDMKFTPNISTFASGLLVDNGFNVAKLCGGSASGQIGSLQAVQEMGWQVSLSVEEAIDNVSQFGGAWMSAPDIYPLLAHIAPVRKQWGRPSFFNLLGPLLNPLVPQYRLLGVYAEEYGQPMAEALQQMGVRHGYVVHGHGGYDEAVSVSPFTIWSVTPHYIERHVRSVVEYGFAETDSLPSCSGVDTRECALLPAVQMLVRLNTGLALQVLNPELTAKDAGEKARSMQWMG